MFVYIYMYIYIYINTKKLRSPYLHRRVRRPDTGGVVRLARGEIDARVDELARRVGCAELKQHCTAHLKREYRGGGV